MSMVAESAIADESKINRAQRALERYREELLRRVAAKLIRPRTLWQPDELREKMVAALNEPVSLDRTLKPLSSICRQLLRIIDITGQARWPLQGLADLLLGMGHAEGVGPVIELLEAGLAFPELDGTLPVESFEAWLSSASIVPRYIHFVSLAAQRCRNEPLDFQAPAGVAKPKLAGAEADGLELLIRLAVLWQTVLSSPLRLTQAGGFFKRDLDRLRAHPLLSAPPAEPSRPIVDLALLTVELGRAVGVLAVDDEQLFAASLPQSWSQGLPFAIAEIWPSLFTIDTWDPEGGFDATVQRMLRPAGALLAAALQTTSPNQWLNVGDLTSWMRNRHPEWMRQAETFNTWVESYLLGLLHAARLVESVQDQGEWLVRLSAIGRNVIGKVDAAPLLSAPAQTLIVQPNLEVILFRQGLTPALTLQLTRFAEWKAVGLACTLVLTAESVYRGLESGLAVNEVQRILERHSTRPLSESVLETLRSWASKRERVQVYPSAVLLEFRTANELEQALKQGLLDFKLTDRIGMVAGESQIDYTRFRLVGTRDYLSPEERCVDVATDGLTLTANDGRADLLFGAEVRRFSDPIEPAADDRSRYRMSLDSLRRARSTGIDMLWLDDWFTRRAGSPLPATARLLFLGRDLPASKLERLVILRAPTAEVADGIARWPEAARVLVERLGPLTFSVAADRVNELQALFHTAELRCEE